MQGGSGNIAMRACCCSARCTSLGEVVAESGDSWNALSCLYCNSDTCLIHIGAKACTNGTNLPGVYRIAGVQKLGCERSTFAEPNNAAWWLSYICMSRVRASCELTANARACLRTAQQSIAAPTASVQVKAQTQTLTNSDIKQEEQEECPDPDVP